MFWIQNTSICGRYGGKETATWRSHIKDLEETFDTLAKFLLKLNPNKFTFGVHSRKF